MLRRPRCIGLALALLCVGCGTGISLDPGAVDPPHTPTGDDGGKIQTIDAAEDGEPVDAEDAEPSDAGVRDVDGATQADSRADGGDAVLADAGATPDRPADRTDVADRSGDDAGDATDDLRNDVSLDAGPDVSIDAFTDSSIDASFDVSTDLATDGTGDAGDVRRDGADASDGPTDVRQDTARDADAFDAFEACSSVSCWPNADYYVDSTAPPGGNGSKLQPFKTITAAIQAHDASPGVARKAYVAAGRYDEVLGERFPLVLRGLSLEGAGQGHTSVVGTGRFDHSVAGGSIRTLLNVTMLIGDRQLPTRLFGLTIQSLSPLPVDAYYGVFCDRGNATGEVASPQGLTHLDQVTVGPGYASDVAVVTSTIPTSTGCNMLITRSTITAAWRGVVAKGCGSATYDDPVMLEMGTDDPASGNTVSWMTAAGGGLSVGVTLEDCLIRGSFQYNTFTDSVFGVRLADTDLVVLPHTRVDVSFKHNVFERCHEYGLLANGHALIASEISDNRFSDNTRAANQTWEAVALSMDIFAVGKIRRNEFIGNDTALEAGFANPPGTPADFGTVEDPGNNVFRCNSAWQGDGGDVLILGGTAWAGTLRLAGNAWDHVPPTFLTVDPPPNGVDISLRWGPNIEIDRRNATLSTVACPSGRVPGQ